MFYDVCSNRWLIMHDARCVLLHAMRSNRQLQAALGCKALSSTPTQKHSITHTDTHTRKSNRARSSTIYPGHVSRHVSHVPSKILSLMTLGSVMLELRLQSVRSITCSVAVKIKRDELGEESYRNSNAASLLMQSVTLTVHTPRVARRVASFTRKRGGFLAAHKRDVHVQAGLITRCIAHLMYDFSAASL